MKFIIYVCTRIRNGQYPRLPDFQYSEEHAKYIYLGRELTLEEFNVACPSVFDPNYRNNSYSFCPEVIAPAKDILTDTKEQEIPSTPLSADIPTDIPTDILPIKTEPSLPEITAQEQDDLDNLHWKSFQAKYGMKPSKFIKSHTSTK